MPVSKRGAVPSKQWSCSELKDGDQKLTAVKREPEDDLESKIKDPIYVVWNAVVYVGCLKGKVFPICLLGPHYHYQINWWSLSLMLSWQEYEKELAKMKSAALQVSGIK